ncbi:max-binding protein MNT-like [Ostrinia furnacalis]|uniref:max-binding protein MNT-like n=1 Tax=Ostrinia furnacalis TaxID=93504 RepID=UPI00103D47A1|nr:max-binding protein MNT-like [Ostrinia furnacalis]
MQTGLSCELAKVSCRIIHTHATLHHGSPHRARGLGARPARGEERSRRRRAPRQPLLRPRRAAALRALPAAAVRVCCPPPAGRAPPCPPPPCSPPLTCGAATEPIPKKCVTAEGCGFRRDRVAERLSIAKRERRLDYEREVAARPSNVVPAPPPAGYSLGAERECARATDGRNYALTCERAPPAPCGPGREPPPPRCVELVRDAECTIRRGAHVDPCAHVPRTIIDIDRSARPAAPPAAPPPASPARASPAAARPSAPDRSSLKTNMASRIMERLSLSRTSDASCPKSSCGAKCETTGAHRAGDTGWCHTQPKPNPAIPVCREPSFNEKLKRRTPSRCSQKKKETDGRRSIHSSARSHSAAPSALGDCQKGQDESVLTSPSKKTADTESLKKALKERDTLQEAGRGRIVTDKGQTQKDAQNTVSGSLDIPVPTGAQNVSIRVSLDGAQTSCKINCKPQAATVNCSGSDNAPPKSNKNESWLSLKSFHKKLAGCRKNDSVKIAKDKKPETCPRPRPPTPKPAPLPNPCEMTPAAKPGNGSPSPSKQSPCAPPPAAPARRGPCAPATAIPRNPCTKPQSSPQCPDSKSQNKPTRFSTAASHFPTAETLLVKW